MANPGWTIVHAEKVFSRYPKSSVWKVFGFVQRSDGVIDKSHAVCRICHKQIKYNTGSNTTNFHSHIRQHAQKGMFITDNESEVDDWSGTLEHIAEISQQPHPEDIIDITSEVSLESSSVSSAYPQADDDDKFLTQVTESPDSSMVPALPKYRNNVHMRIANFLISNLEPWNALNDKTFPALVSEKAENLSPDYYQFILLPKLYKETKNKMRNILNTSLGISLSTSTWKSHLDNGNYLTLFAHVLSKSWRNSALVLGTIKCDDVSDSLISSRAQKLLNSFIREDLFCSITCNENNNEQIYFEKFVSKTINCLGMEIENVMEKTMEDEQIRTLIPKCIYLLKILQENDGSLLISDGPASLPISTFIIIMENKGHWIYVYEILNKVNEIINKEGNLELSDASKECLLKISEQERDIICQCLQILRQIYNATMILKEQTHLSMVLPIVKKLTISLMPFLNKQSDHVLSNLAAHLLDRLEMVYQKDERTNVIMLVASLLDPRYKDLLFVDAKQRLRAREILAEETTKITEGSFHKEVKSESTQKQGSTKTNAEASAVKKPKIDDDWLSDVIVVNSEDAPNDGGPEEEVKAEIERYMVAEQTKIIPTLWWKNRESVFPLLSKAAEKYLSMQATCLSYREKLVTNETEKMQILKRSLLPESMVDTMIFLNDTYFRLNEPS